MSKISVIITSYNNLPYLPAAIESVLSQTFQPCEIIIADDASTDGSQQVIREYQSRHRDLIKPIFNDTNFGVSRNRNNALQKSRGELVSTLDGDDRYLPNKLADELQALDRLSGSQIAYSNVRLIDVQGHFMRNWIDDPANMPAGDLFVATCCRAFPFRDVPRNELVNRSLLESLDLYDPKLTLWEDWDFTIRLTKKARVAACQSVGIEVKRHGKGLSRASAEKHFFAQQHIYTKTVGLLADVPSDQASQIKACMSKRLAQQARKATARAIGLKDRKKALKFTFLAIKYGKLDRKNMGLLYRSVLCGSR